MFRLLRYFSIASAVALGLTAAFISYLYYRDQTNEHIKLAEEENAHMAAAFVNSFWPQFSPYIRSVSRYDPAKLARRGETRAIALALNTLTGGTGDVRIKIYTPDGLVVYSPDPGEIGRYREEESDLFEMALRGAPVSAAESVESGDGMSVLRYQVETYLPVRGKGGNVEGVFELYSDITPTMQRIHGKIIRLLGTIFGAFIVLYGVLFLIVRRADRIMHRQHRELHDQAREIEESELKFRSVTQSANDAVISIDSVGRVVSWNKGAERMFGHSETDMAGRMVERIIPERYRPAHRDGLRHGLRRREKGDGGHVMEFEALCADGNELPVEIVLSGWSMHGEAFFTAIVRDVSERRQAEHQLHRTLDELVRSNAELERFAFVASHDLQEPARTLVAYSQLLEKRLGTDIDRDARDFLHFVTDGAKRMQTLIRDLLAYSRVNQQDTPFASVDLRAALDAATENLSSLLSEREVRVRVEGELPSVHGNEVQLGELFQNLIGNAVKFASLDAAPEITISAARDGDDWVISLADNGIGIEPRFADQIFTIFKRLHSTQAYPGTGVGLAICKRIVERHGGRIWVDSDGENGATFRFTLPGENVSAN